MLFSHAARATGRRFASAGSAHTKRLASSSSSQHAFKSSSEKILPIMTAATLCGWGLVTMRSQEEETKAAQCLFGRTDTKAKEVEDKFATYWPRNIMILFGPPGELLRCMI